MRVTSGLQALCQLSALALGVAAQSGTVEVDLIVPKPWVTYELNAGNRLPLVWAVRNGDLFQGDDVFLYYHLYNGTSEEGSTLFGGRINLATTTSSDARYLSADTHLNQNGTYFLTWRIEGSECNTYTGFYNRTKPNAPIIHATQGWNFGFYTKFGGQKGDFLSAASSNCTARTAMAFNVAEVFDSGCRNLDKHDPFPDPAPCDLQVGDANAIAASISKAVDDEFNRTCAEEYPPSYCSKQKSSATRLGVGAALVGLPLLAIFL